MTQKEKADLRDFVAKYKALPEEAKRRVNDIINGASLAVDIMTKDGDNDAS